MKPSRLLAAVLATLVVAAVAHGQTAKSADAAASPNPSTREKPTSPSQEGSADDVGMGTGDAFSRTGGSLMRAGRGAQASAGGGGGGSQVDPRVAEMGFFAVPPPERRVIAPHDLITIIIREQSEFKSEGTSKLDKKASLEAEINQFIRLNFANKALENAVGGVKPTIDVEGTEKFDGKGTAERKDSLSVRLQAEVIDVKPNGNLVLSARRRIKTEDEERVFLVSGIVRVADVTTDNTVLSTQMYDFDLQQDTKGTVRNATRRGWLPRLLDAINPF